MKNNEKDYLKYGVIKILYDYLIFIVISSLYFSKIIFSVELNLIIIFVLAIIPSFLFLLVNRFIILNGYQKYVYVFWSVISIVYAIIFLQVSFTCIFDNIFDNKTTIYYLLMVAGLITANIYLYKKSWTAYRTIILMPTFPWIVLILFCFMLGIQ